MCFKKIQFGKKLVNSNIIFQIGIKFFSINRYA
jgi:hypothetical protein